MTISKSKIWLLVISIIILVWIIIFGVYILYKKKQKFQFTQKFDEQNIAQKINKLLKLYKLTPKQQTTDTDLHICFINLDHRKDRLQHINLNILPYFNKYVKSINRIPAIKQVNGAKGCSFSHVKALQFAQDNNFEHTLIFEDDVEIKALNKQIEVDFCMKGFEEIQNKYDVYCLGSVDQERIVFSNPQTQKYIKSLASSSGGQAYIVHRSYIPILKELYLFSFMNLSKELQQPNYHRYALDQLHKHLQKHHRWFLSNKNVCTQLSDYSDINQFRVTYKYELKYQIPFCIFAFWMNKTTPMSKRRSEAFENIKQQLQVPIILITKDNLSKYTLWPIHPAVQYLSSVHQADYFRIYFLLYIGGGYFDIKHPVESWKKYFEVFDDPNVWMVGVPETPGGVAKHPTIKYTNKHYNQCISNGWFIGRKQNLILHEVHKMQHEVLDTHFKELIKHPAPMDRCCMNHENGYPLRWAELLGELMSQVVPKYFNNHVKALIKMPKTTNYL